MKKVIVCMIWVLMWPLLLASNLPTPIGAQEKVPQYIGAKKCAGTCHKTTKQGLQLKIWQASQHAKAYETLGTEGAKEIAKKMGIADPQKDAKCLGCHTTAHDVSDDLVTETFSRTEGVGCETCHGAGSLYKKRKVMKDKEASIANGMYLPDEKTCLKCHNEESPTYKPFDFEERSKAIAHLKPEKKG